MCLNCIPHVYAYETLYMYTFSLSLLLAHRNTSHWSPCKFISHCDSFLPGSAGDQGETHNRSDKGRAHNTYCVLIAGQTITRMEFFSGMRVCMFVSVCPCFLSVVRHVPPYSSWSMKVVAKKGLQIPTARSEKQEQNRLEEMDSSQRQTNERQWL